MQIKKEEVESFLGSHPLKGENYGNWYSIQKSIMDLWERDQYVPSHTKKWLWQNICECPKCGTPIVKLRFCPHCGQRLEPVTTVTLDEVTLGAGGMGVEL